MCFYQFFYQQFTRFRPHSEELLISSLLLWSELILLIERPACWEEYEFEPYQWTCFEQISHHSSLLLWLNWHHHRYTWHKSSQSTMIIMPSTPVILDLALGFEWEIVKHSPNMPLPFFDNMMQAIFRILLEVLMSISINLLG
jgi:hypothetical protein